jgi:hypothetical protein
MKIVQVILYSNSSQMTTWVDNRPDLKEGVDIELKEIPGRLWRVAKIFRGVELDSKALDFHRKWDNNNYDKHEGLKIK